MEKGELFRIALIIILGLCFFALGIVNHWTDGEVTNYSVEDVKHFDQIRKEKDDELGRWQTDSRK